MNLDFLIKHMSYQLHTYVRYFNTSNIRLKQFCAVYGLPDILSDEADLRNALLKKSPHSFINIIAASNCIYATIFFDSGSFLIGPTLFFDPVNLKEDFSALCKKTPDTTGVFRIHIKEYTEHILFLYNLFHADELTADSFIHNYFFTPDIENRVEKGYSEIVFQHREEGITHNPYDQECREVESIRTGNVEGLRNSWNEDYAGKLGILAKEPLRNYKNIGIVLVTLGSRAAMAGGITPELSYSLSDIYINQIEETTKPEEAFLLGRDAELHYTKLVKDYLASRDATDPFSKANTHISQCKDYIFTHLHNKLTVSEIATYLYLNSSYLSTLFRKQEGKSITTFILSEKIKLAQNMLIYSKYDYIEIATYLGFSSQSHLGKVFKKFTGMTPGEFRNEKGVKYFN